MEREAPTLQTSEITTRVGKKSSSLGDEVARRLGVWKGFAQALHVEFSLGWFGLECGKLIIGRRLLEH